MASASLSELVQQVVDSANKIEALSSGSTSEEVLQSTSLVPELEAARRGLLEAVQDIQVTSRGPADLLEQYQIQYNSFSCFNWLLHFDIFSHVPLNSAPISYEALARLASVPVDRLRSVARMAMTSGLFTEIDSTQITHNKLSVSFATDGPLRDWAIFITKYGAPSAQAMAAATEKWGDTVAKNETAYNIFADTNMPFFEHIKTVPGMADSFGRYMKSQGMSEAARLEHLLDGFSWGGIGEDAHICDIGGSTGFVSIALAKAHPTFRFTVQDLPEAISSSGSILAKLPDQISSRIQFVAHDFFKPQPERRPDWPAPDVYLLRKILHDWPAVLARDILCRLAAALQDEKKLGARIIIMDTILPPPGALGRTQEAKLRIRDLTMAQNFNSKERELGEWEDLFASVEPKLKLLKWRQPSGSSMAVMEVGLAS